jgi:hypothetical protein
MLRTEDKFKRLYRVHIEDGDDNILEVCSFHSLSSLIEWAKHKRLLRQSTCNSVAEQLVGARLKRVVEIEEDL